MISRSSLANVTLSSAPQDSSAPCAADQGRLVGQVPFPQHPLPAKHPQAACWDSGTSQLFLHCHSNTHKYPQEVEDMGDIFSFTLSNGALCRAVTR